MPQKSSQNTTTGLFKSEFLSSVSETMLIVPPESSEAKETFCPGPEFYMGPMRRRKKEEVMVFEHKSIIFTRIW